MTAPHKSRSSFSTADGCITAFPAEGLSVKRIGWMAAVTLALIFVNKAGLPGNLVFFAIVLWMLVAGTPKTAVMGMTVELLALIANTAFVAKNAIWTIARFVCLFAFSGRFAFAGTGGAWVNSSPYIALNMFVVAAALCSLLSGYFVHIAMLKLASFWIGMTGFFTCIDTIRRRRIDTTEWFVAQSAVVCALCAASLALGVSANFKAGMAARGLHNLGFYHSQTMGPAAAMIIIYLTSVFLFAGHRNRWLCLPLIGFLLYCLYLTGSRTGAGTLVFGLSTTLLVVLFFQPKGKKRLRLNVSRTALAGAIIFGVIATAAVDALTGGRLTSGVISFAAKKGKEVETVTIEDAFETRKASIEQSYHNFIESPVFGIGFQVAKNEMFAQNASLFYAPVEKGFLPTCVLEEVGVFGTAFFLIFLFAVISHLVREKNIPGLTLFATWVVSNLGEATFFAMAGHGAYGWMLVTAGIVLGDRCVVPALLRRPEGVGPIAHERGGLGLAS